MKFRKPKKITHRISSVTNGFVQALLPVTVPTFEEQGRLLLQLGMSSESLECVYCGAAATDWDHLRPLVKGRRPTNNLTNFLNLVPACAPCNQSKGGRDWKSWMTGSATHSPASRQVKGLARRIEILEKFEAWGERDRRDLAEIIGADLWNRYWSMLEGVENQMREAQKIADIMRAKVQAAFEEPKP